MDTILPEDGPPVDQPDTSQPELFDLAFAVDWGTERGPALEACRGCITRRWDARRAAVTIDPDALRALDRGAGQ